MKNCFTTFMLLLALSIKAQENQINTITDSTALRQISKGTVEITALQYITSGFYIPYEGQTITGLPPLCRVEATLRPTSSSNIKIELWLPLQGWNKKFLGTGNGGGAGNVSLWPISDGVKRGFATANTDMGTFPKADDAVGMPEKWIDFGHRATHEMTVVAKEMIYAFYHQKASYSYFIGCSTGGQQALMESQKYPLDYNGIIAGAPANNRTHIHTYLLWNHKSTNNASGKILSPKNFELVNKEIIKACAGSDGGAPNDNFLTDPRHCTFDPAKLPVCPDGTANDNCLTAEQLASVKKIYEGPVNPRTGERIYNPTTFGSETAWMTNASQHFYPFKWALGADFTYDKFDFDKDMDMVDILLSQHLNANNPDLSKFKKAGGKLIMYTGTADVIVPYEDALNYYDRVIETQKGLKETQDFFRYFQVPGMGHCGGGPGMSDCGQKLGSEGPKDSEHDMITALMEWVEKGKTPEKFITSSYKDVNGKKELKGQRPVFPYPFFPEYISGDENDMRNFKAVVHERGNVKRPDKRYLK